MYFKKYQNSFAYKAEITTKKIESINILPLSQPRYSPDISPNDFFIQILIKAISKDFHFTSQDERN